MIEKVRKYIAENHLLSKEDRIVVGVSGGADSVCLFLVLSELSKTEGFYLQVVHINHMLRGSEADQDEEYVRTLCANRGVDFKAYHIEVEKLAKELGLSCEEAGRKARYDTFYEVCLQHNCNKIAIAHNKNDNAETFLFHLFRGSSLLGLCGIPPMRGLKEEHMAIIRPLLFLERSEIEAFLVEQRVSFRTDQTNFEDIYTRNIIRNRILPVAKEINANALDHMERAMGDIKEALDYLEEKADKLIMQSVAVHDGNIEIYAEMFGREAVFIQRLAIRKLMMELTGSLKDITNQHVLDVLMLLGRGVGKKLDLPYGICARREYESLILFQKNQSRERKAENQVCISIQVPGEYILNQKLKLKVYIQESHSIDDIPKKKYTKWFDYDKIENTLEIRTRREGDVVCIRNGSKKLKGLFIDAKIPSVERSEILLMADGADILWILDERLIMRISEKYKVTKNTQRIICVELTNVEE